MRKIMVALAIAMGTLALFVGTAAVDLVVSVALWRVLTKPAKGAVSDGVASSGGVTSPA
jgi:hypothetical protein